MFFSEERAPNIVEQSTGFAICHVLFFGFVSKITGLQAKNDRFFNPGFCDVVTRGT